MIRLMTLTAASNFTVSGSITIHVSGVGFTLSSGSSVNISTGGFTFRYYSPAVYYRVGYTTSINGTLDLDALLEFGILSGFINPLDLLNYLSITSTIACGVGTITTDHLLRFLAKPAFKNGKIVACAGWNFQLGITTVDQSLSDYYNITVP